jgi:hypothetical protein
MKSKRTISMLQFTRQLMALSLSALLIPAAQLNLYAQAPPPAYAPLDAAQLDQLVAPIALYPDALVAQILTASTYPDQVAGANNWLHQNMMLPPDQRGAMVDGMPWDPSVKALTAFPSVLDNLARNYNWASQLGNAYYNQPGDVMNAVQATRFQAQQAGVLVSTPQQRVYADNGAIMIAPVNPALVYVPYYNPWRIWGPTVVAYPGYYVMPPPAGLALGIGIGFGVGISVGLFAHYGWGYGAWAPNWHGGVVLFNRGPYYSRSVTVFNHGNFGAYNRGVFEQEGRGVPGGFHPAVTRAGFVGRPEGRAVGGPEARPVARPEAARPAPAVRPEAARAEAPRPAAARPAEPAYRPAAPAARPAPAAQPQARGAAPERGNAGHAPAPRAAPAHPAGREGEKK